MRRWLVGLVIALASVGIPLTTEPAAASGPPLVSVMRVLPSSSATIKLSVDLFTNSEATTVVVDFGTTTAYGASSRPIRVSASPENSSATIILGSITPGTAYDLRVVVSNASGEVSRTFPPIFAGGVLSGSPGAPVGPTFPTIPISGSGPRTLTGVACARAATCYAVGWAGLPGSAIPGHSIIERFTGSAWVSAAAPAVSQGFLQSVSCASASFCVAVGEFIHQQQLPLIEELIGGLWREVGSPVPPAGGDATALTGVSCPTINNCVAVGITNAGTNSAAPLVERLAQGRWRVVPSANPGGSFLDAVSCMSTVNCWAVGLAHSLTPPAPSLVEHVGPTSASVVASPSVGPQSQLTGVACPTPSKCLAVGGIGRDPLVLSWNGGPWRQVSTTFDGLLSQGVPTTTACPSSTSCWILVEGRADLVDGTTIVVAGHVSGMDSTLGMGLTAAACFSASRCVAVAQSGPLGEFASSVWLVH